ncbi:autotransporter-associated beta strand repeat-containing protein [uncultured Akkermansia sp.]|uniref:autotransporter-associated beta strand repeat-containing protein n=3 Tax=uncultured Akkermansia sp. TaxID=512294 RepID=UPI0026192D86|nr:autotransporter-associated beta strand repeat-containing protein [uncultured Akkermansia sp.]
MRPHLPLVLLSALLSCFISPAWSDYTLTGNGETTISFADDQYTITPPEGEPLTQADSPGGIYLTDITASGTYQDGYNRVLNLEGGTYTGLQLWNVAGTAGGVTIGGNNSFVINIGEGTSLLNTNAQLMGWSNQDRIVSADITLNVDRNAGTINGFSLVGDGNKNDAYQTTGTYTVNIHGGEWAGISVSNPSSSWCIGLGQESFRHTGDVTFTIDGGTFAQLVTAGTTRGAGQKSTIIGNVSLNLDGGTFNGSVALLGRGQVQLGDGTNAYTARLRITGGQYNANVYGLSDATSSGSAANIAEHSSASIEITGGTFAQSLFSQGVATTITGAAFSGDGTRKIFAGARLSTSAWNLADTNMTLDLGGNTVAAMIAGGSWVETGESTLNITGSTNLTFKSGTYTGQIWGGSYINGTATAALTGNIGSTNITITGGTFDGAQISLGTYVERNNANSALTIGEANLSISGGTFNNASIYAGGQKVNGTSLTTALASVTLTGNDAVFSGTTTISGQGRGDTVTRSVLNLNGVTREDMFENVVISGFDEISAGEGTDAIIANATVLDGRSAFTKSGAGKLTLGSSAGFANALTVSAGELSFGLAGGVAFGNSITMGAGARLTSAGNMTLSPASVLTLDLTGLNSSSAAVIQSGGTLSFSTEGTLTLTISGVDQTMENDYRLIAADSFGTLTASNFSFDSSSLSEDYTYALELSGNTLYLRVKALGEALNWNGGSAGTWTATGGSAIWLDKDGTAIVYDASKSANFEDLAGISASAVTIDGNVSSARLTVNNGETAYTFTGTGTLVDGTGPMSLIKRGEGVLTIENTGANTFSGGTTIMAGTLNLNVVQGLGTGTVTLNGGELVLNTEGTTGLVATNNIIFGGGTFTYGTGAAQDISGLIDAAASTAAIRVNTNGNNISWATYTQELGNKDIVKLGNGLLTINTVQGGTFAGAITVNEGTLFYSIGDNSVTRTWSGNVSIAENATLQIQDNRAHNSVNTDTLSGRITGAGTLVLGKKEGGAFPGGGRYSVTGDNSGFTGTMRLAGNGVNAAWNEVGFANAAAIGGATLELDGRGFFVNSAADPINADIHVMAAGGWLNGNSNQTLVLAGSLTSEAGANLGITAAGDPTLTAIFTGDLTGFMGTVHSGRGNAILSFGNGGAASTLDTGEFIKAVSLGGTGTYRVNYTGTAGNLLYAGNVIDTASLSIQGSDKLILTGANTTTGELNISQNSSVQLGDGTGDNAAWAGTIAGAGSLTVSTSGAFAVGDRANGLTGTLTLAKGTLDLSGAATTTNILIQSGALANAGSYAGTDANKVHVHAIADSGNIALGGLEAAGLGSVVTTAAGTQLTGLKQGSTWTVNGSDSNLAVGAGNISGDPFSGEDFLVQFEGTGDNLGGISFEDGSTLTLDLTSVMNAMKTAAGNLEILLTNGSFAQDLETLKSHITANPLFAALGFGIVGVNGGGIVLSGDTDLVYVSSVDGAGSADNPVTDQSLNFYQAVIVDQDLYVQSDGSMVIKNLTAPGTEPGQTGTGSLIVTNTAEDKGSIELQNSLFHDGAGVDTSFAGDIRGLNGAAANTDLVKTGANKLTLSGNVSLAGDIIAEEGTLQLNGTADVEALHLNSADAGSPAVIGIGGRATAQALAGGDNGGKLDIAPSGTLTLTGATDGLSHTAISGPGTLAIAEGASLGLAADSTLSGVVLDLGGSLSLEADGSAGGLNGSGSLELNGQTLQIQAASGQTHTYDGTLGEGTLDVSGAGTQVLHSSGADTGLTVSGGNLVLQGNADVDGSRLSYGNLVNNGNLTIQASDNSLTAVNTTLSVENASFSSGSTTTFTLNTDADMTASFIEASGDVVIEDGASFHVSSIPDVNITWKSGNPMELTLMELTGNGTIDLGENTLTVGGLFLTYYKNAHLVQEGDKVVLKAEEQTDNIYAGVADTANSMAGANLLWDAARNGSVDQTVTDFLGALNKDMLNNPSAARHSLAAMAGSTVNALGTAQRDALRDQMGWIRNRTTLMGVNPAYVNDDLPRFHMWMEGTGSYAQLDTRGDESGYRLTTWGGTVGMDADLSDRVTVGAAFTASYGDLTASAADSADGHLDSYYASLFGRYQNKRWAHTLILTGGWNDAKLNRTVNYGEGSYSTQGSTSGWGLGAMYELTYDIYLDENRSSVLQPLFNASVVTTRMDGYEETGAGNAGLNVGRQDWTTGTVALGGRWMGLVGSNIFGREALGEIRVNAAQDLGDRRGETNVSLLGNPGFAQSVRGAKAGTTALQLGAGLSVPVGTKGTVFVNGNADIRDGSSSVNGSVGYRYDF